MTVMPTPQKKAVGMEVWTASRTAASSRAPSPTATATPAPTESPMKSVMIRLLIAPVAPTAATEMEPQY